MWLFYEARNSFSSKLVLKKKRREVAMKYINIAFFARGWKKVLFTQSQRHELYIARAILRPFLTKRKTYMKKLLSTVDPPPPGHRYILLRTDRTSIPSTPSRLYFFSSVLPSAFQKESWIPPPSSTPTSTLSPWINKNNMSLIWSFRPLLRFLREQNQLFPLYVSAILFTFVYICAYVLYSL